MCALQEQMIVARGDCLVESSNNLVQREYGEIRVCESVKEQRAQIIMPFAFPESPALVIY